MLAESLLFAESTVCFANLSSLTMTSSHTTPSMSPAVTTETPPTLMNRSASTIRNDANLRAATDTATINTLNLKPSRGANQNPSGSHSERTWAKYGFETKDVSFFNFATNQEVFPDTKRVTESLRMQLSNVLCLFIFFISEKQYGWGPWFLVP